MSRVLISGGSGFLGRSLLEYLLKNTDHDVYTLSRSKFDYFQHRECDLLDIKRVKEVLEESKPELVFHLAGTASPKPSSEKPSELLENNILGTFNLIHCLENKPRVVFSSSSTVYGYYSKNHPPYWATLCEPISLYATGKLACENILRVYHTQEKIKATSIRIPALTGTKATHGLVQDLFRKITSDSEKLELFGVAPGAIKPFCHIDEIAEIFYQIGVESKGYDEIGLTTVVSSKDSLSVLKIANTIMEELGIKKEIVWNEGAVWLGDNREIYLTPCFTCKLSSEEAIRKVCKEYIVLKKEKNV